MNENPTTIQLLKRAAYCLSSDETQVTNYNLATEIEKHLDSLQETTTEFPSLGEEVIFLRKENQRLAEKCNRLTKELVNIRSTYTLLLTDEQVESIVKEYFNGEIPE